MDCLCYNRHIQGGICELGCPHILEGVCSLVNEITQICIDCDDMKHLTSVFNIDEFISVYNIDKQTVLKMNLSDSYIIKNILTC